MFFFAYKWRCSRSEENTTSEKKEEIIERTTEFPITKSKKGIKNVFFGRRTIYSSLEKSELTVDNIIKILPRVLREHDKNSQEIDYLYNYYKGNQPILYKEKIVRPEINNKVIENHAFEIVEFKKAYVYGKPIQYVQKGEKDNEEINPEISILNKFMESEDKSSKDEELASWQYICGTSYRWTDVDTVEDEDEAPFEISIPDPRRTFVVYSSGIKQEQLFSGHYSWFYPDNVSTDEQLAYTSRYRIITIYTENKKIQIKENAGVYTLMEQTILLGDKKKAVKEYPLIIEGHRIVEYPLNNARIGLIELVITQLDALNRIKSDDIDGIDQFVQSLLVFVNQSIDVETYRTLVKEGAIQVVSQDPGKPADVKLLTNELNHTETKVVTDDLYDKVLTTVGIPRLNNKPSGGDTGQARLLGEGWTMADERANQDELYFKRAERQFLKLILKICKKREKDIKNLKISDIDIKFTRNKSDNLIVKTQGLMNMKQAQVDPSVAFVTCELFSDPNDVYNKSKKFFGEDFWKEKSESEEENILAGEGEEPVVQDTRTTR